MPRDIWGRTVTDAQWAIRDELGDQEVKSMVCGPAGENLVKYANVMTGIKNAGGRTGMGCVMGSKNLKAVACRGTMDIKNRPSGRGLEFNKRFIEQITSAKSEPDPGNHRDPLYLGATNSWGGIRCRNFQYNQCEYADDIEPEHLDEIATETIGPYHMTGCSGARSTAGLSTRSLETPLCRKYDEGPEYTSQGAFCGETDTPRAETLLVSNHLVDQYGVETWR